jgi:pyruvate/2-oxoglutarate dehydrogenase complex dihydrolipoamide acyltransferase (E2) component
VVAWFVREGERVLEGDRLLEIVVGAASIEIDAPGSGLLAEIRAQVDDTIAPGQVLGIIRERE